MPGTPHLLEELSLLQLRCKKYMDPVIQSGTMSLCAGWLSEAEDNFLAQIEFLHHVSMFSVVPEPRKSPRIYCEDVIVQLLLMANSILVITELTGTSVIVQSCTRTFDPKRVRMIENGKARCSGERWLAEKSWSRVKEGRQRRSQPEISDGKGGGGELSFLVSLADTPDFLPSSQPSSQAGITLISS
jgi:hypothetical protein